MCRSCQSFPCRAQCSCRISSIPVVTFKKQIGVRFLEMLKELNWVPMHLICGVCVALLLLYLSYFKVDPGPIPPPQRSNDRSLSFFFTFSILEVSIPSIIYNVVHPTSREMSFQIWPGIKSNLLFLNYNSCIHLDEYSVMWHHIETNVEN